MTVETREREQHFRFPCKELGVDASNPGEIPFHTLNYFTAMSWVLDLFESSRSLYVDVGCGSGYGTEMLAPFFKKSVGIDRDLTAISYARLLHSRAGTEYLLSPDFDTNQFNKRVGFITIIEALEHIPEHLAPVLLQELAGWLSPEGVLFITTPQAKRDDGRNPDNRWHLHEYQEKELRKLLERFFAQVTFQNRPGCLVAIAAEPKT